MAFAAEPLTIDGLSLVRQDDRQSPFALVRRVLLPRD